MACRHGRLNSGGSHMLSGVCRYILTSRGMNAMYEKYKACEFGRCPRVLCNGQPCLPVGTCDVPRQSTVKIFCPKCQDIYYPRSKYQVKHPQGSPANGILRNALRRHVYMPCPEAHCVPEATACGAHVAGQGGIRQACSPAPSTDFTCLTRKRGCILFIFGILNSGEC